VKGASIARIHTCVTLLPRHLPASGSVVRIMGKKIHAHVRGTFWELTCETKTGLLSKSRRFSGALGRRGKLFPAPGEKERFGGNWLF
jgi:hypothetical protein